MVMKIDDLLKPFEDFAQSQAWKESRLHILATVKIIQRLDELKQPDLVLQTIDTLERHMEQMKDEGTPVEEYYNNLVKIVRIVSESL